MEAFIATIAILIVIAIVAALLIHNSARSTSGSPRQLETGIRTVQVNRPQVEGIRTISTVASMVELQTIGIPRGLPVDAECGWCGNLITQCLVQGRGPVVLCETDGCHGVSCQSCFNAHGHRCSGRCGAVYT